MTGEADGVADGAHTSTPGTSPPGVGSTTEGEARSEKAPDNPDSKGHPIAEAIDRFIHRIRDTKYAARQHIRIAVQMKGVQLKKIRDDLEPLGQLLKSEDRRIVVLAQNKLLDCVLRLSRIRNSDVPGAIEVGLFLAVFAAFDAFTGDLLRAVFKLKPALFGSLKKSIDFADVLSADSLDTLRTQVLDEDIEDIRRKSYVDQFGTLATRFDVKLTSFARWPAFVECSQRRNLLTHADGLVNEQYCTVCASQGLPSDKVPPIGTQLTLGPEYFFDACELVLETGFKLGQTIWRKTLPDQLDQADTHLMSVLFGTLENHVWRRARMIGEFGMSLKTLSSDWIRKAILVNYVQALKRDDAVEQGIKVLGSVDWTAAGLEFRLAEAVLKEDYTAAADWMRRVGPKDGLLNERAYHTWPLFLEFRNTEQFARAYFDVFGHTFAKKLEEVISKASVGAAEEEKRVILAGAEVDAALQRDQTGSLVAASTSGHTDESEPTAPPEDSEVTATEQQGRE